MTFRKIILAAFLTLVSLSASAGFISLQSNPSVSIKEGRISAAIDITNLGDESAYELITSAFYKDASGQSGKLQDLPPDVSARMNVEFDSLPALPGIYTMVFRISYKDSSGKTYSALNAIAMVTDIEAPPDHTISLTVPGISLSSSAVIQADILPGKDLGEVTASLYLPEEIFCLTDRRTYQAKNGEKNTLSFRIKNERANPGSKYLALLIADYSIDGSHYSKAVPFNITVETHSRPAMNAALFTLLTILTIAGFMLQSGRFRMVLGLNDSRMRILELCILVICILSIELLLFLNLSPRYLLMNTTAVGGDTPAHNYIASHLKASLFGEGRIISWAGGWWCGFPMFQFYFSLPYLVIVLLDLIIPFNVAFKLVAVAGILVLAPSAWGAGRLMKLPRPAPLIMALLCIPVLFDRSHMMWGVNIYSTLAGMISNSLSFPLMLLFLGSAWRDAERQKFNALTSLLLTAVLMSHFFTSIVGLITAAIIPFLRPRRDMPRALGIFVCEAGLGLLLAAWWLIPLLAKIEYTADFGVNWNVDFIKQLPAFIKILSPLVIPAVIMLFHRKTLSLIVPVWMLTISIALFFFGFSISSVFVNVRLWPFIIFSLVILEAAGIGYLLSLLPAGKAFCLPLLLAVIIFGIDQPNHVPAWSKWNFEGLESKAAYPVFEKLVLPLKNTPGRLANDLCEENNSLGSSRIFELTPHLTGKPVLEGGIVNSAPTSMFSYYIQSETSRNCAGFPTNVKPTSFNITNATLHLELFNVKHFIARWETTRSAMHGHPLWQPVAREMEWELFELTSHDGNYVFVPEYMPFAVETHEDVMDWKTAGLEWIYNITSISNHFIILKHNEQPPDGIRAIPASRYLSIMKAKERGMIDSLEPDKLPQTEVTVTRMENHNIEFTTSNPGVPHIIKMTWYPNWKSRAGEKIHMITPSFMMIIPDNNDVKLYYGYTVSDRFGQILAMAGVLLLLAICGRKLRNRIKPVKT